MLQPAPRGVPERATTLRNPSLSVVMAMAAGPEPKFSVIVSLYGYAPVANAEASTCIGRA